MHGIDRRGWTEFEGQGRFTSPPTNNTSKCVHSLQVPQCIFCECFPETPMKFIEKVELHRRSERYENVLASLPLLCLQKDEPIGLSEDAGTQAGVC